jgi:putative ABC transport system substrate-binding protein
MVLAPQDDCRPVFRQSEFPALLASLHSPVGVVLSLAGKAMRRREFITGIAGSTAAWPVVARAQQPTLPVIGFLSSRSPGETSNVVAAFLRGLGETGYVDGRNVVLEYRWAEGQLDRLPALAADLVRRRVAVISTTGGPASGIAAQQATSTIPIVFIGSDPVKLGFVASLNRPGGNMTGVNNFLQEMEGKRLGLLRELLPNAKLIVALVNPNDPEIDLQLRDLNQAARTLGQEIHILRASSMQDIDAAFASMSALKPSALLVGANPFFNSRREQIVTLANHYRIPAIYEVREFVMAGGLMSYGTSLPDAYRQVGIYTGRILKGEKPADLPVVQLAKFEFVINLRTAKSIGLEVPGALSARADEVIE